jgi:hypothetical protein
VQIDKAGMDKARAQPAQKTVRAEQTMGEKAITGVLLLALIGAFVGYGLRKKGPKP